MPKEQESASSIDDVLADRAARRAEALGDSAEKRIEKFARELERNPNAVLDYEKISDGNHEAAYKRHAGKGLKEILAEAARQEAAAKAAMSAEAGEDD